MKTLQKWLMNLTSVGSFLLLPLTAPALTTYVDVPAPTVEQATYAYDIGSVRVAFDNVLAGLEASGQPSPFLGQAAGLVAAKTTVNSMGGDILPATTIRTIARGETVAALEAELAELTYKSGGLEHAVVSLQNGERVIVSGGRGGIEFGADIKRVIGHTHPTPTGPSAADFQMLQDTGQRHSYIYELFGGGRSRFNLKE